MENVVEDVKKDIEEMRKLKVYSKPKADKMAFYVNHNEAEIQEYRDGGMKIAEITELVSHLAY